LNFQTLFNIPSFSTHQMTPCNQTNGDEVLQAYKTDGTVVNMLWTEAHQGAQKGHWIKAVTSLPGG